MFTKTQINFMKNNEISIDFNKRLSDSVDLFKYLGKNVKIILQDETITAKVIGHTSELDNEPDDDGNYGGEYIEVRAFENFYKSFIVSTTDIFRIRFDGVWIATRVATKTNRRINSRGITGTFQVA